MQQKKKFVLAIIPARGGSKGLKRKNIKKLNNKPLITYTINEARKSKLIDHIVVSTEDKKIRKICEKERVSVIKRPMKLAMDSTPSKLVYQHSIKYLEKNEKIVPDIIIILLPTSPLRTVKDIDSAIKKFVKNPCDLILSVNETSHPPTWSFTITNEGILNPLFPKDLAKRRQDSAKFYQPNGAIYVTNYSHLMGSKKLISGKIKPYLMPEERSVDIDNLFQFHMAELLIKSKK